MSLLDAMCPVASHPNSLNMGLHLVKGDGNFRTEKKREIPVIALFDMNGKLVFENIRPSKSETIHLNQLPSSVYILTVTTKTGNISKKIIKE